MYKVYILYSSIYNKSYVGVTNNFERRFQEHNTGKSIYTKKYCPWQIVFIEEFEDKQEAYQREKF